MPAIVALVLEASQLLSRSAQALRGSGTEPPKGGDSCEEGIP